VGTPRSLVRAHGCPVFFLALAAFPQNNFATGKRGRARGDKRGRRVLRNPNEGLCGQIPNIALRAIASLYIEPVPLIWNSSQHVISTLYLDVAARSDLHQLSVKPAGLRPSRTVLRDRLRFPSTQSSGMFKLDILFLIYRYACIVIHAP
jgi:hypothetical protein